jgi:uncharacterized protein YjiS (DUF1127 family)
MNTLRTTGIISTLGSIEILKGHDIAAKAYALISAADAGYSRTVALFSIWQQRIHSRNHLATMDHRLLRDIGITIAERDQEANKNFWRQ